MPKKTEEDPGKGRKRVGGATKGRGLLNVGVVYTSIFLILELIYCLAESSPMRYVLSRCQRKDQSDERASLLDMHSSLDPVILVSLFTYTVISFSFTCIYGQLEWAASYICDEE